MPGTRCAVAVCNNSLFKTKKIPSKREIRYHSFPKEKLLRQTWVIKCKRNDQFNPETSRICSEHFKEDQFERDMRAELLGHQNRKVLKINAMPTEKLLPITDIPQNTSESERHLRMHKRLQKKLVETLLATKSVTTRAPGVENGMKDNLVESPAEQDVEFIPLLNPPKTIQNPPKPPKTIQINQDIEFSPILNPPNPPKTIQNPPKPPKTIQNPPKPPNTIQNPPKPPKTIQNPSKPPKTIQINQDIEFVPILNQPKPPKTIQVNQDVEFGPILNPPKPPKTIQINQDIEFGPILNSPKPLKTIQNPTKPPKTIQINQDVEFGPILNPPKPPKTIQINQLYERISFLENKCNNLEKKCSNLQKSRDTVIRQRKEKNKLVNKLKVEIRMKNLVTKRALKELKSLKNEKNKKEQLNSGLAEILQSVFSTNQIKILLGKKRVKWGHEDLRKAITLHYYSKKAYLFLKKDMRIPLPGLSTLRAYSAKLNAN